MQRTKELKELIEQLKKEDMKCKDCTIYCDYITSDAEKECAFQNHVIQVPDEWQGVRIQAAIAAMQGVMGFFGSIDYNRDTIAKLAVEQADALIDKLKEK